MSTLFRTSFGRRSLTLLRFLYKFVLLGLSILVIRDFSSVIRYFQVYLLSLTLLSKEVTNLLQSTQSLNTSFLFIFRSKICGSLQTFTKHLQKYQKVKLIESSIRFNLRDVISRQVLGRILDTCISVVFHMNTSFISNIKLETCSLLFHFETKLKNLSRSDNIMQSSTQERSLGVQEADIEEKR